MSDINWIQTKAGLQMAETIIRQLPRITVCLEEIAKNEGGDMFDIKGDSLKLIEEMDKRKQENINLSHRIQQLETIIEERK